MRFIPAEPALDAGDDTAAALKRPQASAKEQPRRSFGRGPSEGVETPLEQAELVALWIGEDVPGRLRRLTDVD